MLAVPLVDFFMFMIAAQIILMMVAVIIIHKERCSVRFRTGVISFCSLRSNQVTFVDAVFVRTPYAFFG